MPRARAWMVAALSSSDCEASLCATKQTGEAIERNAIAVTRWETLTSTLKSVGHLTPSIGGRDSAS